MSLLGLGCITRTLRPPTGRGGQQDANKATWIKHPGSARCRGWKATGKGWQQARGGTKRQRLQLGQFSNQLVFLHCFKIKKSRNQTGASPALAQPRALPDRSGHNPVCRQHQHPASGKPNPALLHSELRLGAAACRGGGRGGGSSHGWGVRGAAAASGAPAADSSAALSRERRPRCAGCGQHRSLPSHPCTRCQARPAQHCEGGASWEPLQAPGDPAPRLTPLPPLKAGRNTRAGKEEQQLHAARQEHPRGPAHACRRHRPAQHSWYRLQSCQGTNGIPSITRGPTALRHSPARLHSTEQGQGGKRSPGRAQRPPATARPRPLLPPVPNTRRGWLRNAGQGGGDTGTRRHDTESGLRFCRAVATA